MKKTARTIFFLLATTLFTSGIGAQPFGQYIHFDGIDDKLTVLERLIPEDSDFTVEFWARKCEDSIVGWQVLMSSNDEHFEISVFSSYSDTQFTHNLCSFSNQSVFVCDQGAHFLKNSDWHHFAIVYRKYLEKFKLYYDGNEVILAQFNSFDFKESLFWSLGAHYSNNSFNHTNYEGDFDEFRISDTIRYHAPFTPQQAAFTPDAKTYGLWQFEEDSVSAGIFDASANGFDFTAIGDPILVNEAIAELLITQTEDTLQLVGDFSYYQWIDCDTGTEIPGATSPTFIPSTNGNYAVNVGNNCDWTSECFSFVVANIDVLKDDRSPTFYPNPANTSVTIDKGQLQEFSVELIDNTGRVVHTQFSTGQLTYLDLQLFAPGVYFLRMKSQGESFVRKLVLQ